MVLPEPAAGCLCTVVIPARNESGFIARALDALCRQCDLAGQPLEAQSFEVIVFANGCADDTAGVVRAIAARHSDVAIHLLEAGAGEIPHVGIARRTVMDFAAERFMCAGKPGGIIASTDADTIVAHDWVARIVEAMESVDAVAGSVCIDPCDLGELAAGFRDLYRRELEYRAAFAQLDSMLDPVSYDPWPRHASFVGAAFAVRTQTYLDAGRLPAVPLLEDREFFFALRRSGARVRHSVAMRATTSARRFARVEGGFGTFVADLLERSTRRESLYVENPELTVRKMRISAIARRIEAGASLERDVDDLAAVMTAPRAFWMAILAGKTSSGALCEALIDCEMLQFRETVTAEAATLTIRALIEQDVTLPWRLDGTDDLRNAYGDSRT